jgi:hypothetical protein
MPNHVKNVLTFKKLTEEDKKFILNTITNQDEDGSDNYWIDFDKIIPEPRLEAECPKDCKVNKDSYVEEDKERPWFDWYTWRNKYWGTKWNAYDRYSLDHDDNLTLVFNTAWSMPYPVIKRLHLLGFDFKLQYADEDYGVNCGKLIYEKANGFTHYDESKLFDPETFAKDLWEEY